MDIDMYIYRNEYIDKYVHMYNNDRYFSHYIYNYILSIHLNWFNFYIIYAN